MKTKNETTNSSKPMVHDMLLWCVAEIFKENRDVTYYSEQMKVQSYFKSRYGFKCSMNLAHRIILAARKENIAKAHEIMDYFRHKRYGFNPAN